MEFFLAQGVYFGGQIFIFESFYWVADLSHGYKAMASRLFHRVVQPDPVQTHLSIDYRSIIEMKVFRDRTYLYNMG